MLDEPQPLLQRRTCSLPALYQIYTGPRRLSSKQSSRSRSGRGRRRPRSFALLPQIEKSSQRIRATWVRSRSNQLRHRIVPAGYLPTGLSLPPVHAVLCCACIALAAHGRRYMFQGGLLWATCPGDVLQAILSRRYSKNRHDTTHLVAPSTRLVSLTADFARHAIEPLADGLIPRDALSAEAEAGGQNVHRVVIGTQAQMQMQMQTQMQMQRGRGKLFRQNAPGSGNISGIAAPQPAGSPSSGAWTADPRTVDQAACVLGHGPWAMTCTLSWLRSGVVSIPACWRCAPQQPATGPPLVYAYSLWVSAIPTCWGKR